MSHFRSIFDQLPTNLEPDSIEFHTAPSGRRSANILVDHPGDLAPVFGYGSPWELCSAPDCLLFQFDEQGLLEISDNDTGGQGARLTIQCYPELAETIDAFLNPHRPVEARAAFRQLSLSALVDKIYFAVSVPTCTLNPEAPDLAEAFLQGDFSQPSFELRLAKWSDVAALFRLEDLRKCISDMLNRPAFSWSEWRSSVTASVYNEVKDPKDERLIRPDPTDIAIFGTDYICPAGACFLGIGLLGVALRLKSQAASILFVLDLLRHSTDCANIGREIAAAESWKNWLSARMISAPHNRLLQIHHAIAFRHARQAYLDEVATLSDTREPFNAAFELFYKRKTMVRSLHDNMLLQVEALLRPLPFFVEYPYAHFVGTADQPQRLRYGKILLNVVCKILVFLPLEELQHRGKLSQRIHVLVAELQQKPSSDGALLDLSARLGEIVKADELTSSLELFGDLVSERAKIVSYLGALVTARNRANHPPFDEKGFIEVANTTFPVVISQMRGMFTGVQLLVPKHVRPAYDKTQVMAVNVMGDSLAFGSSEIETSLSADNFVVEELFAYRARQRSAAECLVPLTNWFCTKTLAADSMDVGLYDRMERNKPQFSFVTQ